MFLFSTMRNQMVKIRMNKKASLTKKWSNNNSLKYLIESKGAKRVFATVFFSLGMGKTHYVVCVEFRFHTDIRL